MKTLPEMMDELGAEYVEFFPLSDIWDKSKIKKIIATYHRDDFNREDISVPKAPYQFYKFENGVKVIIESE